ncbi:unnamed protein product [Chilo suppressalis]|uniref:Protein Wnt n=1 Tax=Chilo suppressalis TaxID=168631 RepID=A0ABN8B4J1_CHISP|nr:unnamed protein product [Chilo suppressalis]
MRLFTVIGLLCLFDAYLCQSHDLMLGQATYGDVVVYKVNEYKYGFPLIVRKSTIEYPEPGQIRGLTPGQRRICRRNKDHMPVVSAGVKQGIAECQHQFRDRRWNCTVTEDGTVFGPLTLIGSRETAFAHAVTSAGASLSVSRACRDGRLASCSCGRARRPPGLRDQWLWAGCGDDLQYGYTTWTCEISGCGPAAAMTCNTDTRKTTIVIIIMKTKACETSGCRLTAATTCNIYTRESIIVIIIMETKACEISGCRPTAATICNTDTRKTTIVIIIMKTKACETSGSRPTAATNCNTYTRETIIVIIINSTKACEISGCGPAAAMTYNTDTHDTMITISTRSKELLLASCSHPACET